MRKLTMLIKLPGSKIAFVETKDIVCVTKEATGVAVILRYAGRHFLDAEEAAHLLTALDRLSAHAERQVRQTDEDYF